MFHDKKRGTYRVSWYDDDKKRRTRTFKKEDRKKAMLFELQIETGEVEKSEVEVPYPTFKEFSERWYRDYCQVEKSESQWLADASVLKHHLVPAFGGLRLDRLKKSHLLALKTELHGKTQIRAKAKTLTLKYINNILGLAKKMLNTAVDLEILKANPWTTVKPFKLPSQKFAFWTPDERDRAIAHIKSVDPDFAIMVAVACHTGMRLGELGALRRSDLDFERSVIHVGATYNVALKKRMGTVKGKVAADIPMNSVVREALGPKRFLKADHQVFALAGQTLALRKVKRYAEKAGVPVIRMHDLRHTFASCLAMAGMDLMRIQQLCRHKTYQMTLRYAHLHPSHLSGATEVLCGGYQTVTRTDAEKDTSQNPCSTRATDTHMVPVAGLEPVSA